MLANWIEAEQRLVPAQRTLTRCFAKHSTAAKINLVFAFLAEILGPMFWAALIIAFALAELSAG
jgi:hypothetical protein